MYEVRHLDFTWRPYTRSHSPYRAVLRACMDAGKIQVQLRTPLLPVPPPFSTLRPPTNNSLFNRVIVWIEERIVGGQDV